MTRLLSHLFLELVEFVIHTRDYLKIPLDLYPRFPDVNEIESKDTVTDVCAGLEVAGLCFGVRFTLNIIAVSAI